VSVAKVSAVARITKDLIAAQAAAAGRKAPTAARAEALAEAVGLLVQATDEAAAALPFEAEPAHILIAFDETAAR